MNKKRGGLGRGIFSEGKGISAIISDEVPVGATILVAVDQIRENKHQPRRVFDEQALDDLASSIKQFGVLQPIVVRQTEDGYELVAGERRWRASKRAGLTEIPAVVKRYNDTEMTEIALIENLQRENLTAIEEAIAYKSLMQEFGLKQEELAQKMGRSRSYIANVVRLLALSDAVQEYVSRGTLTMGQVRPLVVIEDEELQLQLAEQIAEEGLSARACEELVKRILEPPAAKPAKTNTVVMAKEFFLANAEERLKSALGTQVKIKPGKTKNKIEIEFYSEEELERLLDVLTQEERRTTRPSSFHV